MIYDQYFGDLNLAHYVFYEPEIIVDKDGRLAGADLPPLHLVCRQVFQETLFYAFERSAKIQITIINCDLILLLESSPLIAMLKSSGLSITEEKTTICLDGYPTDHRTLDDLPKFEGCEKSQKPEIVEQGKTNLKN